jgi:C1A family cysteine protease
MKPSTRFIYYNEREMTGQMGEDCTVRLRDALKAVTKRGVCPESLWPFRNNEHVTRRKPRKEAFAAARKRRVLRYRRIQTNPHNPRLLLQHLKHCLAEGHPFVFGFYVYDSFEGDSGKWKEGVMPVPNRKKEKNGGGHAVMAVGYDDDRKCILVRNSWGESWAQGGYFRMPYKLITDPKFAFDFWTLEGVTG